MENPPTLRLSVDRDTVFLTRVLELLQLLSDLLLLYEVLRVLVRVLPGEELVSEWSQVGEGEDGTASADDPRPDELEYWCEAGRELEDAVLESRHDEDVPLVLDCCLE